MHENADAVCIHVPTQSYRLVFFFSVPDFTFDINNIVIVIIIIIVVVVVRDWKLFSLDQSWKFMNMN